LYGTDLTGAKLDNIQLSINCHSFRNVRYDRLHIEKMLFLMTLADIPDDLKSGIRSLIPDARYQRLATLFGQGR
jgi:hypothetical protein